MSSETEEQSQEKCKFERLHTQIILLRWLVLAFFIMGSACVGLLFTHLWHDTQAFKAMRTAVIETQEAVESLADEMKRLHPHPPQINKQ